MKKQKAVKIPRYHPLDGRVLVKMDVPPSATPGGILLPDIAQDPPKTGEVLAVGPGNWNLKLGIRKPMSVKAGEHVLFNHYTTIQAEEPASSEDAKKGQLVFIRDEDLLATVE